MSRVNWFNLNVDGSTRSCGEFSCDDIYIDRTLRFKPTLGDKIL